MSRTRLMELPNDHPFPGEITPQLITAAAAGDRGAMREIYDATADAVFRLMLRMVGQQDASDLTQNVFLRAFSHLGQFSGEAKFETWLYRVAANEALQHLRREKLRRTKELVVEPAMPVLDNAERDERAARVRDALDQLDPELRTIFTLKEESGLSYQEIAAALEIPAGTVGSRLNRARRALRKILGSAGKP